MEPTYDTPMQFLESSLAGVTRLPLFGGPYDGSDAPVPKMFGCIAPLVMTIGRDCYRLDLDGSRWLHLFTCGRDWHCMLKAGPQDEDFAPLASATGEGSEAGT